MTPELRALLERHPAPWVCVSATAQHLAMGRHMGGCLIFDANECYIEAVTMDDLVDAVNAAAESEVGRS